MTLPSSLPFLRLFLARHGETDWNTARRLQGSQDTPLNERGQQQARKMCSALSGIPFEHIYTSTQRRSIESAAPLVSDAPRTQLAELSEQSLGAFEGRYMDGREPEVATEYLRRLADHDDTLDGGESVNQHLARVTRGVHRILERHPTGLILVVAHGATNAAILRCLFDLSFEASRAERTRNCEVRVLDVSAEGRGLSWRRWEGEAWDGDLVLGTRRTL